MTDTATATPPAPAADPQLNLTSSPAPTGGASSSPPPAAPTTATPAKPPTTPDAPAAAGVPIEYNLTLPENSVLPSDAIERTTAIARELGLSNDAAQRMLVHADSELAAHNAAIQAAHQKQVDEWKAQVLADNTLGRTPETRKAAIDKGIAVVNKYTEAHPKDGDAFKGFLNETGLGNNPTVVRFFAWLGKSAGEAPLVQSGGEAPKQPKRTADVLYGNPPKKGSDAA